MELVRADCECRHCKLARKKRPLKNIDQKKMAKDIGKYTHINHPDAKFYKESGGLVVTGWDADCEEIGVPYCDIFYGHEAGRDAYLNDPNIILKPGVRERKLAERE